MPLWLTAVASFLSSKQQQKEEANGMRAKIAQQYASSLGAPPYEMEAAQFNADQKRKNGGMPNLMSLAQLIGSIGGGGDDGSTEDGWQSQKKYRGPGKVTSAGYAGNLSARDF